jgi:hypothetical protein
VTPVEFPEQMVVLAKDQPQYQPLPIHVGEQATATSCWRLSVDELAEIQRTGVIWIQVITFGQGFHPILPHAFKPELAPPIGFVANDG